MDSILKTFKKGYKFCSQCKIGKPFSEFKPHKVGPFGWYSRCLACSTKKQKEVLPVGFCRCIKCKEIKELTTKHFQKSSRAKSGFDSRCKICIVQIRAEYDTSYKREYAKEYNRIHKKERAAYIAKRRKEDPAFRARSNVGQWTRQLLRANKLKYSKIIGCTQGQFVRHLESLFEPGMTWENYGNGPGKWQIDHIKSLALAILEGSESFSKACNYKNLQPLWHSDHAIKTAKDVLLIRSFKAPFNALS
jgi:hypothetical protein